MKNCEQCGSGLLPPHMARKCVTTLRCKRCGCVYRAEGVELDRISPDMVPLGMGVKLSPWMLPWTRPVVTGFYDCRFSDVAQVLRLHWNGRWFEHDGQRVLMTTFQTWRGTWK